MTNPTTTNLVAPTGTSTVWGKSGAQYTVDPYGIVAVLFADVPPLLGAGFVFESASNTGGRNNLAATTDPTSANDLSQDYAVGSRWVNTTSNREWICVSAVAATAVWIVAPWGITTPGANGLLPTYLSLMSGRNTDGSTLAAAAAAGKFGSAITLGTSQALVSEAANSNTKTDDALFEYVLPANYIAGQNLTVTVQASLTGAGTLTTKTAQIKAYKTAAAGTQGANIGPAAQVIVAAGSALAFTITGTTLNPGDRVLFELETVLTETGAVATNANINSIKVA